MSDWSDPLWHQLYTSPHQQAILSAPQPPQDPAYIQILQDAASQGVPLQQITLAGVDETARAS